MSSSLKPSKELLEQFYKECERKCMERHKKMKFFVKPAAIEWEYQKCRNTCVENTIEKERPKILTE